MNEPEVDGDDFNVALSPKTARTPWTRNSNRGVTLQSIKAGDGRGKRGQGKKGRWKE